ncbi:MULTISPECIES: hypothetical protein [Streptomyces]|uniref:hypothetical protein n=1 Tax=Streptomyces TaxID=1883 RepID=UPI000B5CFCBC|nr:MULTISPECIES: hypothetical protein [Streptomyces]
MTLPVHHRPGHLMERAVLPSPGWVEPIAAVFDDLFQRMSRFLEQAAGVAPSFRAFSPLGRVQHPRLPGEVFHLPRRHTFQPLRRRPQQLQPVQAGRMLAQVRH